MLWFDGPLQQKFNLCIKTIHRPTCIWLHKKYFESRKDVFESEFCWFAEFQGFHICNIKTQDLYTALAAGFWKQMNKIAFSKLIRTRLPSPYSSFYPHPARFSFLGSRQTDKKCTVPWYGGVGFRLTLISALEGATSSSAERLVRRSIHNHR
jgi:hypothetical protein